MFIKIGNRIGMQNDNEASVNYSLKLLMSKETACPYPLKSTFGIPMS